MNQLPVVSFRPEGRDHFMALMMHMVGTQVEVTYVGVAQDWGKGSGSNYSSARRSRPIKLHTKRGEIVAMDDVGMSLKPCGIPRRYSEIQYLLYKVPWSHVKMLEVIGHAS